jgi:glutamate carboxypeptidase
MFKFRERIEKLMGRELKAHDLSFIHAGGPISELEMLKSLAEIETGTLNVLGVEKAQELVAETLRGLHFKESIISGEGRFAKLRVFERPGRRRDFITLITHTDTVLGNDRPFEIDLKNGIARGSGVIDNKGGVVVGLSALSRWLKHFPETEYSVRFVSSPNEEMGSIGFTDIFRELGRDTVVGFGLEPGLDNGSIIHQRRGNRWYNVRIEGREAHAGRSYGEHANAAHDLSQKIYDLSQLTNYRKHVSVNVGHLQGGKDRHNIICGLATAKIDARFPTPEARDTLHRRIEKILLAPSSNNLTGLHPTKTSFEVVDDCPPFALTRRSKRLARTFAALISQIEGRKIYSQPAGGAGDVNYLSTDTNFILDGLGPIGGQMHTPNEFLQIDTLASRAKALAGFLHHLQSSEIIRR